MIKLIHFSWQYTYSIEKKRLFRSRGQDSAIILEWEGGMPSLLFWPRYHSVERLVYNPATDSCFVVSREGCFRTTCFSESVTGPHFTLHEASRTLFYLIPKNANSTQMGTILHELGFHPNQSSPSKVWDDVARRHLVYHQDYDETVHGDYKHVAVYRDPLDRFINLANYAWCIDRGLFHPYTRECSTKSALIDTLLLLISMNRSNHPGVFEQHLEGQAWYYHHAPRIDVVIPIERLNDYMRQVMKVEPFFCNVDSRSELTAGDMSAGHMDMLRDVWSEDFNLKEEYGHLFWEGTERP